MKIKIITWSIRKSQNLGIFHDSREDVRTLTECVLALKDKINELINVVNVLQEEREQNE